MAEPNYTLGKGEVWFAPFAPGTQNPINGEEFLGNCPEFNLTQEEETLPHYASTRGLREKDAEVTLQQDLSGSIQCDDVKMGNLARFFSGAASIYSQASASAQENTFVTGAQGRAYQLGVIDSRPTGHRSVTVSAVAAVSPSTPASYTLNTDYTVDSVLGRVVVVEGGGIAPGTTLKITYNAAAVTREQVISGTSKVEGALRFIAYNEVGKKIDWFMPWVKFSPNGDLALIGEEWQRVGFNLEVLKKSTLQRLYADGRPVA